ncbi:hypothetical protein CAPTEDRAFT_187878 [Capitella teleta]|uniref:Uncharacterized protein n=1 Tax=Capitella teleta TaxID=283909 RepID=R7VC14_CAPTE|nr:hypothetical protein CAPTEDRAFT_187878 [Capitella teleta]|eukprot:ELU13200.1 hypothetical protein CAPTEDRAFT_187878 [Capitella teleta]
MSSSGDIERLVHSLEFENQQYVREIEKEKKLICDLENKVDELRDGVSKENERTSQLDDDTKRFHKQFTINRSNISSLNNTLAMLAEQKEARQNHLEMIQQQTDAERAKQQATLDHYEGVFKDFSEVYGRSQLAEQLKGLTITRDAAQHKMQAAQSEAEQIKQKMQAFSQNADSWLSTDALKKHLLQAKAEGEGLKRMILHKLSVIYEKEKEQKRLQEEKQRADNERQREEEEKRRIEEQRRAEEEDKRSTEQARKATAPPVKGGVIRTPSISMPSLPQRQPVVPPLPRQAPMPTAPKLKSFSFEIPSLSLPLYRALPPRMPDVPRMKVPLKIPEVKQEAPRRPVPPVLPQSPAPSILSQTPPSAKLSEPKTPFISCTSVPQSPSLSEKSYSSSPFNLEKIRAHAKSMFKSPGSDFGYEARTFFEREAGIRETPPPEPAGSGSFSLGPNTFQPPTPETKQPNEQLTTKVDSPPEVPASVASSKSFDFSSGSFGGFSGFGGTSDQVDSSPVAFSFGGGAGDATSGGGGGGGGGGIFGMFGGGGGEEEEAQGEGGDEGGFSFSFGGGSNSPESNDKPGFSLF